MDYELELKNEQLENMIHVYEEHINALEKENKSLKLQVDFLKQQLEYIKLLVNRRIWRKKNEWRHGIRRTDYLLS